MIEQKRNSGDSYPSVSGKTVAGKPFVLKLKSCKQRKKNMCAVYLGFWNQITSLGMRKFLENRMKVMRIELLRGTICKRYPAYYLLLLSIFLKPL